MSWRFWTDRPQSGFAAAMRASFPADLAPPSELLEFFAWQEANNLDTVQGDLRYARLDPDQPDFCMCTMPVDPGYAEAWYGEAEQSTRSRVAPFFQSGDDGSVIALWRDNAGKLAFVHMGSGSGSTLLGILTRDPIDFLRLIAVGYDELCWPNWYSQTPEEAHSQAFRDLEDRPYQRREKLQKWVEYTFDVAVPRTASEIITSVSDMDDPTSQDDFWKWNREVQRWDR